MTIDPIQLELMRNLFEAAAEEMGLTLQRIAFSANIKERRDFSCALFDPSGQLLAQAAHIPVHLGSMPASVAAVLDRLGKLDEGDAAIVNDPYAGGTHLPDLTLISPVYFEQQLLGYVANRAHHADVGGQTPGSMTLSRSIEQEGLRLEPALLVQQGRRNTELFGRILAAVRTPHERQGDLDAQIAANHIGATALQRMAQRHGRSQVLQYGNALLDYAQAFMSRLIRSLPDGAWTFEDAMDDDGAGNSPIPLRVVLSISDDLATLDLTASADQVPGCINCPRAVTQSAIYYCFACLLEPGAPLNGGCFRNINILTRPGSLVDAQFPAAVVAGNTETSQRIVDLVLGALAGALPHRIPAASCGTMNSVALGTNGWTYYETIGGGTGAGEGFDGTSAIQCHMTNTLNTPAEALELQYPLRIRRFERAPGTGGAGQWRGGDGIVREIELLQPCQATLLTDRRLTCPWGLFGGQPASPGQNLLIQGQTIKPLPGKTVLPDLPAGAVLRIVTPGGGGWGAPDRSSHSPRL